MEVASIASENDEVHSITCLEDTKTGKVVGTVVVVVGDMGSIVVDGIHRNLNWKLDFERKDCHFQS